MDGLGTITWWGFSPCIDLLGTGSDLALPSAVSPGEIRQRGEINILLLGCGDLRHCLKTVSRLHRKTKAKVNFYIVESSVEVYARHALFLALALEDPQTKGLQEKTELFLEIFGDLLVRHHTAEYVQTMATELIKIVTDEDYNKEKLPVLDVTQLKFKERDMMETIFKFWKDPLRKELFDAAKCWDLRLRNYLGVRYDSRKGVFDWDYSMKLCDRGAEVVGGRTYANWRSTGVAFGLRDGTYDTPNRTLASVAVFNHEGERAARRGYWGDIIISPYIAFGVESDESEFFVKRNNELTKTSEDVSEHNVLSFLYELQCHKQYKAPDMSKAPAASESYIEELSEELAEVDLGPAPTSSTTPSSMSSTYKSLPLENVSVKLLPINTVADFASRSKYEKLFDVVCISASMLHHLTPQLTKSFADGAAVYLEKAKYLLELNASQCQEFDGRLADIAAAAGCKSWENAPEGEARCYAKYRHMAAGPAAV